ncbi:DUF397 domain-containing protein [Streptomyces bacillaris]|uniref:DUF397 domain-containing protein n=1 Tax=Streptomyces bacillaris TaxID=68179 RepID=UPI0036F8FDA9
MAIQLSVRETYGRPLPSTSAGVTKGDPCSGPAGVSWANGTSQPTGSARVGFSVCEVAHQQLQRRTGGCVDVAPNLPHVVPVRDSKRSTGPAIAFGHHAWRGFVRELLCLTLGAVHGMHDETPRSIGNPVAKVKRWHRSGAGDP